ncbi:6-carboxytetrahydropterin synthase [bacterium]|nr:6-carboxytetrahydropterin synthase [bacterium]
MYSITVRNNILIAHSLPGEVFGPAQNMHGATYVVDAEFFAEKVNKYNIIMDLGVVTDILSDVLKFYSYKNLDEVEEFKGIITSTEFLAKDIYDRICAKLKNNYLSDYQSLNKLKITLTESNVAWASFEQEIEK